MIFEMNFSLFSLASSIARSTASDVMFSVIMVIGPNVFCDWADGDGPPGEAELNRFHTSFVGRPLPNAPLFLGVTTAGDSGSVSSDSLSESCMLKVRGDFVNRLSGPRGPGPLLFGSCVISETGLLLFFLCIILLSAVVTVWFVPDIAS